MPLTDAPRSVQETVAKELPYLSPGQFLLVQSRNEYFWVRVEKVLERSSTIWENQFSCVVDNHTINAKYHGYRFGDRVLVRGSQIYRIMSKEEA